MVASHCGLQETVRCWTCLSTFTLLMVLKLKEMERSRDWQTRDCSRSKYMITMSWLFRFRNVSSCVKLRSSPMSVMSKPSWEFSAKFVVFIVSRASASKL